MKPSTLKMTNPAKKLVPQLIQLTMMASLREKKQGTFQWMKIKQ